MIDTNPLQIKLNHRNWKQALSNAFNLLAYAAPGEVVCIVGPSRAGKSRLIEELQVLLGGKESDVGYNPRTCVTLEAESEGSGGAFSTKAFTYSMLEAVGHPFTQLGGDDIEMAARFDRTTESAMKKMLKSRFVRENVRYLFIDEAQHVKYSAAAKYAPHAVMDSWKSFAAKAKLVLVVVGTYPIINIIKNSSHLAGRTAVIQIDRYQKNKEDFEQFLSIASAYKNQLERAKDLKLKPCIKLLHAQTFGCIGLLRLWFIAANARAHTQNLPITIEILKNTAHPKLFLKSIWDEISQGEKLLETLEGESLTPMDVEKPTSIKQAASKSKPFNRNAQRYEPGNRVTEEVK
tara:strand:+ start:16497 stop:17540 length:1044 start_codon:yes stop_codon:yes gene_type:complete